MKQNNVKKENVGWKDLLGDRFMSNLVIFVEDVEAEKRRRSSSREEWSQSYPQYVPHTWSSLLPFFFLLKFISFFFFG